MQGDGWKTWKDTKPRRSLSYYHNCPLQNNGSLNFLKSHQHPLLIEWTYFFLKRTCRTLCQPCHVGTLMKKFLTCWCKHSNTSIAKCMTWFSRCQSRYDTTFAWALIVVATPWKKTLHETRFAPIGPTMITFTKMRISFVVSTISTCHHDD
jgi:hypothetical protein